MSVYWKRDDDAQDLCDPVRVPVDGGSRGDRAGLRREAFFDTHYYDPLRAEPHTARIKILVPAWSKAFPDSLDDKDFRFAWQATLGRELPIVAFATDSPNQRRVRALLKTASV